MPSRPASPAMENGPEIRPEFADELAERTNNNGAGAGHAISPSTSHIEPYNGHYSGHFPPKNVPAIPVPTPEHVDANSDHLSRSLPDFRGLESANPGPLRPFRTKSETTIKRAEPPKNGMFPSNWLPGSKRKRNPKSAQPSAYSIEYSVFHPVPHFPHIDTEEDLRNHLVEVLENDGYHLEDGEWPENNIDAHRFGEMVASMVHDVETDTDLRPVRISQGSSGSYFILGKASSHAGNNIDYTLQIYKKGIFKPKDEEPYGPLSPKWSKWLHRTFFPCFFGRSCLIPNLGYISEAAACVLDRQLLSFIVPYTDIIHLKSSQFYYSFWERTRKKITYKIGSFQLFLTGYVEANVFLKQHPFPQNLENVPDDTFQLCHENDDRVPQFFWSKALICQLQDEIEKLVILDYIMRNTDRGSDNWMIKVEWVDSGFDGISRKMSARLRVGAIDSGLAFPWKHPDEWRSFPFGWLFLPYYIIGRPFSHKTRKHFLPLLTSKYWWEQTTLKLKAVFQKDADFKERMWHKQIAVLKGQAFNVVEVLKNSHAGPLELIRRENLLIWDDTMNVPAVVHNGTLSNAIESSIYDVSPLADSGKGRSAQLSETTPLLSLKDQKEQEEAKKNHMSGFDYNMTFDRESPYEHDETNTKTVIIERLEKVYSKRPVFTWC